MKLKTSIYVSVILAVIYIAMALFAPLDPAVIEQYKISESNLRLLNLTISLPILIIWFMAIYGFARFMSYANLVSKSKEGPAYNQLATGLMLLAFSLPVTSVIAGMLKIFTLNNPEFIPEAEIIKNYIGLLFAVSSFFIIAKSSRKLTRAFNVKSKTSQQNTDLAAIILITFSCLFTWLIMYRPTIGDTQENIYFLPNWLILLTLAIPYLFAWRAGIQGAYHLYKYHEHQKAEVYRTAFKYLAVGIGTVVIVSILIQSITTISEQVNRLNLTPLLMIIYGLLILYAIGFGLVAKGARKLKKIEEV